MGVFGLKSGRLLLQILSVKFIVSEMTAYKFNNNCCRNLHFIINFMSAMSTTKWAMSMTLALVNSLQGRMAFRIFWNSRKSPCAFSQLLNSIDKSRT